MLLKKGISSAASCVVRKAVSRLNIPAANEIRKAGVGFASLFGVKVFRLLYSSNGTYGQVVTLLRVFRATFLLSRNKACRGR